MLLFISTMAKPGCSMRMDVALMVSVRFIDKILFNFFFKKECLTFVNGFVLFFSFLAK